MAKRLRGWFDARRNFFALWGMEILVVVIGITIAFALQGWAADAESKRRAAAAELRIQDELVENAFRFVERLAVYPCLHAQIVGLSEGMLSSDPDWRPVASADTVFHQTLASVYKSPSRSTVDDAYRSALAASDLAALAPERQVALADIYAHVEAFTPLNNEEWALAAELKPLQFGLSLSDDRKSMMLARIARLDDINATMRLMAEQYLERLEPVNARLDDENRAEIRATWPAFAAAAREKYGQCWNVRAILTLDPMLAH